MLLHYISYGTSLGGKCCNELDSRSSHEIIWNQQIKCKLNQKFSVRLFYFKKSVTWIPLFHCLGELCRGPVGTPFPHGHRGKVFREPMQNLRICCPQCPFIPRVGRWVRKQGPDPRRPQCPRAGAHVQLQGSPPEMHVNHCGFNHVPHRALLDSMWKC